MGSALFRPLQLGSLDLSNRIVMAPMTRLRAINAIPTDLMAEYYAQRASAGLIITECTMVSSLSQGYMNCPGIFSAEQIEGWKKVTTSVHNKGGKIFLQIWHCGRISHSSLLNGESPIAPSAIAATGSLHTPIGKVTLEIPRALETEEIPGIIAQFRQAALNAITAGFDGIELHGAFGYLIDQFLQDGSNQRRDRYGGSIENRARFLLEVTTAVCEAIGRDRVGIKLSPSNTFYGMRDSNPIATFQYVLESLSPMGLAYVHLMEPNDIDRQQPHIISEVLGTLHSHYSGTIVTNGGYTQRSGDAVLTSGQADLVSYGKPFIANPDLPTRFAHQAPLIEPDVATFYGMGDKNLAQGYTDYPLLIE